ncbi:hypothetical protein SAMN05421854_103150 [Amycolatopsis rubida]|uniref:Uncharacterized protein n=1 Tax=Amycolatopsis rubida TaxID=112413 RepID=A0A1I5KF33_9PSEU|nr:hypothetical protein SAMN05421854_103150 [Amycolatopsis rubida]
MPQNHCSTTKSGCRERVWDWCGHDQARVCAGMSCRGGSTRSGSRERIRAARHGRHCPVRFGWPIVLGRTVRRRRIGPSPGTRDEGSRNWMRARTWLARHRIARGRLGIRLSLRRSTCRPATSAHSPRARALRGVGWPHSRLECIASGRSPRRARSSPQTRPSPRAGSPTLARSPRRAGSPPHARPPRRTQSPTLARSPRRTQSPTLARPPRRTQSPTLARPPRRTQSPTLARPRAEWNLHLGRDRRRGLDRHGRRGRHAGGIVSSGEAATSFALIGPGAGSPAGLRTAAQL